jgi:hypothetical protein
MPSDAGRPVVGDVAPVFALASVQGSTIEQGLFVVDKQGVIRHVSVVGPIDPVPKADRLAELVREHCATQSSPA